MVEKLLIAHEPTDPDKSLLAKKVSKIVEMLSLRGRHSNSPDNDSGDGLINLIKEFDLTYFPVNSMKTVKTPGSVTYLFMVSGYPYRLQRFSGPL
jgi:hypothetical protein